MEMFSVYVNKEDEDNWLASLDLCDLETGETLGILDAGHEDQLTACVKLARFCLTLGYHGTLLFYDDAGHQIAQAKLNREKVVMRPAARQAG